MMETTTRLLVSAALALVGDAAVTSEWDLLVILVLVGALLAMVWIRQGAKRLTVTVRPGTDVGHEPVLAGRSVSIGARQLGHHQ
jgi:hypothetical protein